MIHHDESRDGADGRDGREGRDGRDGRHIPEFEPVKRFGFSEIQSLLTILLMAIAGIAWGLKLDYRLTDQMTLVSTLQQKLDAGILPITKERLEYQNQRIESLERRLGMMEEQVRQCQHGQGKAPQKNNTNAFVP